MKQLYAFQFFGTNRLISEVSSKLSNIGNHRIVAIKYPQNFQLERNTVRLHGIDRLLTAAGVWFAADMFCIHTTFLLEECKGV